MNEPNLAKPNKPNNGGAFADAVLVAVVLLLIALTAWNTIKLMSIKAADIERNRVHTCFVTELIVGPPSGASRLDACEDMRDQLMAPDSGWAQ